MHTCSSFEGKKKEGPKHLRSRLTSECRLHGRPKETTCLRSDRSQLASFPACSPCRASVCLLEGWSNGGRSLGHRRGGSHSEEQPGRARANRSTLRRRPITSRLARQICPAVRGGAAKSPGAAGYTSGRLQEAQVRGVCTEKPEEG